MTAIHNSKTDHYYNVAQMRNSPFSFETTPVKWFCNVVKHKTASDCEHTYKIHCEDRLYPYAQHLPKSHFERYF